MVLTVVHIFFRSEVSLDHQYTRLSRVVPELHASSQVRVSTYLAQHDLKSGILDGPFRRAFPTPSYPVPRHQTALSRVFHSAKAENMKSRRDLHSPRQESKSNHIPRHAINVPQSPVARSSTRPPSATCAASVLRCGTFSLNSRATPVTSSFGAEANKGNVFLEQLSSHGHVRGNYSCCLSAGTSSA